MQKIKTINKHKLLSRIFKLQKIQSEQPEYADKIDTVISNFKILYPYIDITDIKEVYNIEENGVKVDKVSYYNYGEYEKPYMDFYQELLDLQFLCNKYFRPEFRTMVGEKFWCTKDFKEYEVLYIQEKYKAEQMFLLINEEYNKELIVKVNEWRCGHLQGEGNMYSSKVLMLEILKKSYTERYKEDMERLERLN